VELHRAKQVARQNFENSFDDTLLGGQAKQTKEAVLKKVQATAKVESSVVRVRSSLSLLLAHEENRPSLSLTSSPHCLS
jgi:hypothetical protein